MRITESPGDTPLCAIQARLDLSLVISTDRCAARIMPLLSVFGSSTLNRGRVRLQ